MSLPARQLTDLAVGPVFGTERAEARVGDEAEERAIVGRMARGDDRALAELYERLAPRIFRFLRRVVDDPAEAEEILQDTLVAAWQSARRFEGRSRVRTWLLAIARRQARDRRRRRQVAVDPGAELPDLADPNVGPEAIILERDAEQRLAEVIARLDPAQREILDLAFVQELSYSELADVLGVPIGTVKSRLHAARQAMRRLIGDRWEELP